MYILKKINTKKKLGKWLLFALLAYIAVGAALYFLQDVFLLHPDPLPENHTYNFKQPFNEKLIQYDSDTRFSVVQFTIPD